MTTKHKNGDSPFDPAWTWVGSLLVFGGILIFLYQSTGNTSLFPTSNPNLQDDAVVTAGYIGMITMSLGLGVLGHIAWRYVDKYPSYSEFSWPRLKLVEGDIRDKVVARFALAVVIGIPTVVYISSTISYSESSIALWDETQALDNGFWTSRLKALQTDCDNQPCFRMHPLNDAAPDAWQWIIYLTDPLALIILCYALYCWLHWAKCAIK